jgi:hypothetical protein
MSERTCERCGKQYWPKQAWIHVEGSPSPTCCGGVNRRLLRARNALTVTQESVTESVTVNTNAERQRRYRERKKAQSA